MAFDNRDVLKRHVYFEGNAITWYDLTSDARDYDEDIKTATYAAGVSIKALVRFVKSSDIKLIEAGYKPEKDIIVEFPYDSSVDQRDIIEWNSDKYLVKEIMKAYNKDNTTKFSAICVYSSAA